MGRRAVAGFAAVAVGIGLLVAAVLYLAPEVTSVAGFKAVADEAKSAGDGAGAEASGGIDWAYLDSLSPDIVAYLTVDNTNVDFPVVQSGDNDYYLWRGLDGQNNGTGTPYMDYRCASPDGDNVIVYGHHMGVTHTMFDALSETYDQATFDGIGTVRWSTRDKGTVEFRPAFAMRVYKDYDKLYRFQFKSYGAGVNTYSADDQGGDPTFTEWLAGLLSDASASCADAKALCAHSDRALTLVTCSEVQGGQPWRCLLVCVPEPKLAL